MLCSYVEQILAGRTESLKIHVIYYDMEHLAHNLVVPGHEGGRYGSSEQVEKCLERIARTSGGRFHSFKASGTFYTVQCLYIHVDNRIIIMWRSVLLLLLAM